MPDLSSRLQRALGERYSIEGELGSGGAGIVFLAEDVKHGRKVALKVLRPEVSESLGGERFLREIQISARLSHPHILSLIDSGEADGLVYYVMFHVAGESLRARLIREKMLAVDEAIRLTREVAEALDHAHGAGVIHRDIKPENILLEAGHALVCDFGIAKALGEARGESLTATGLSIGTPAYMSPEQATAADLDARTDVYSLGCVLYEMLSGGPPYHGSTPQAIMARKAVDPIPDIRVVRETVPASVEAALKRALAKVPADRFTTAGDFARALLGGAETLAPTQAVPVVPGPGWGRRLAFTAATAGLAAAVTFGVHALMDGSRPPPPAPVFSQVTALPGVEDSPSLAPDGLWVVYAGGEGEDRDVFLQSVGGQLPINLTEDSGADDYDPAFSPSGELIAFRSGRDGGGLFVMGRTGEAVRRVSSAGFNPSWSPDESHLAYATEHVGLLPLNWETLSEIWIVDLATGDQRRLHEGDAVQPAWSPDGRWVAFAARWGERTRMDIWIIPAEGGEPRPVTDDIPTDWSPTWTPDGAFIYFSSDRGGSMNLWRIPMDQRTGSPQGPPEAVTTPAPFLAHPSISADGRNVAYSHVLMTQNIEKAALDIEAGELSDFQPLTSGSRQWSSPDPSSDGELVTFYSRDLPEGDVYVVRGDGTGLRMVTGDSALDRIPRWSPDGARIAYFSNRGGPLHLWLIRGDGSGNTQLTGDESAAWVAWSPDGSQVAVNTGLRAGSSGPTVMLLDPDSTRDRQVPRFLPASERELAPFRVNDWSPDGRLLAGMIETSDAGIIIFDLESEVFERLTDFGQWPVWLPDSRHLLFVSGGNGFYVVDRESRRVRRVFATDGDVIGPPRVTRDGRMVVFSRRRTEGDIWLATFR